jgi:capsular polysaccharide export protein
VLVVDQTAGDSSIRGGLADAATFHSMIKAALDENPDLPIVVKIHPEVVAGKKRGHLHTLNVEFPRVQILSSAIPPDELFPRVAKAYVCSSQVGFDALLRGIPVVCFGVPFYAGWGLTDDRIQAPRRRKKLSLDQLVAGALLIFPRYINPESLEPCVAEDVIDHLALQRQIFRKNAGVWTCYGFSKWKHQFVRSFLAAPGGDIHFANSHSRLFERRPPADGRLLAWGERGAIQLKAQASSLPYLQMEDGLLRSVGLGSDLHAPYSLVVDERGVYYDPSRPSDLEDLLSHRSFTVEERERAKKLRETIIESRVTKYNLKSQNEDLIGSQLPMVGKRLVVLVPGQVEDDASIRLGCPGVRTNEGLLAAVRKTRPHAYILFKPHPDVLSGNRRGHVPTSVLQQLCDQVVESASLADCLEVADEVHTMTSLVGFEALLRGRAVTAYGQPFYSGWGLTHDEYPVERRKRRLSLDELVFATYVLYPRYYNYEARCFTTPEWVIDRIRKEMDSRPASAQLLVPRPLRQLGRLFRALRLSLNARS